MRWWLALVAGAAALLAFVLLPVRGSREPNPAPDAVNVVRSSGQPRLVPQPAQQVVRETPPPAPASAPSDTAGGAHVDAPSWMNAPPELDPRALYRQIRGEARDRGWAPQSESAIRSQLDMVPHIGQMESVVVRCASTICEVSGVAPANQSAEYTNGTMQVLQDAAFRDALQKQGLAGAANIFGSDHGRPTFTLYYTRAVDGR